MSQELEEFHKIKIKTRAEYDRIGKVFCPALKSDIVFNSDGFHHLSYDRNRSERDKRAQLNKFRFLQEAVNIFQKSTTIQEYRRLIIPVGHPDKGGMRKTDLVEWFGFYAVISFSRRIRVMAVVRRIGAENGKYHFWSVMPYWKLSKGNKVIGVKTIEDR
ncbi:MAG: hypothetical protein V1928_03910 [Parcubacteria group bacterium]